MINNFLYQLMYQILMLILPLITIPYTSRVLGVEGVGVYSYSYAIVSYFISFANMGVNTFGNREIAAVQDKKEIRSQKFWDLIVVQVIYSIISMLTYAIIIFGGNWENKRIFIIQGIYIIGQMLDINWFFFGMEKFKITVTRNLLVKLITTFLVFLLVKVPSDVEKYILILAIGTAIGNSAVWVMVKQYIVWKKPQIINIKRMIKPTLLLVIPSFAVKMYTQMDKIFIKIFSDVSQVGFYENAEKIINIAFVFVSAISTIILPRMANLFETKNKKAFIELFHKSIGITSWLTIALMFGMLGIADIFIKVYLGAEYIPCIIIVIILAFTIPVKGCAEIMRRGYIIPTKCDYIYIYSILGGAISNIIVNILLIPTYGAVGAAIGTVIAEIIVFLIQAIKIRKDIEIFSFIKENMICFFTGVLMLYCVRKVYKYLCLLPSIVIILVQILLGLIIYLGGTGIYYYLKNRKRKGNYRK